MSVIQQTYQNVEIVVVDDGSTDESVAVIEALRKDFPFKFLSQKNQGVCRALNNGIRRCCRGEYIALLGSDDIWRHDKLELQMAKLNKYPNNKTDFCYSQAISFISGWNPQAGRVFPRICYTGNLINIVVFRQHVPAGTILVSRKLYDQVGGFDENLLEEDWDFVIRCASMTEIAAVNIPLLYYRSHDGNTMKTRKRKKIFQEKAKILAKNFHLLSSWRWVLSLSGHFFYDIIFKALYTK